MQQLIERLAHEVQSMPGRHSSLFTHGVAIWLAAPSLGPNGRHHARRPNDSRVSWKETHMGEKREFTTKGPAVSLIGVLVSVLVPAVCWCHDLTSGFIKNPSPANSTHTIFILIRLLARKLWQSWNKCQRALFLLPSNNSDETCASIWTFYRL